MPPQSLPSSALTGAGAAAAALQHCAYSGSGAARAWSSTRLHRSGRAELRQYTCLTAEVMHLKLLPAGLKVSSAVHGAGLGAAVLRPYKMPGWWALPLSDTTMKTCGGCVRVPKTGADLENSDSAAYMTGAAGGWCRAKNCISSCLNCPRLAGAKISGQCCSTVLDAKQPQLPCCCRNILTGLTGYIPGGT